MNQHAKFEIKGTILWIELFVKDEHINGPFDSKSNKTLILFLAPAGGYNPAG